MRRAGWANVLAGDNECLWMQPLASEKGVSMRAPRIPAIVQSRRLAEFDSVLTHGVVRHKNLEHDKAVIDGHQYLVWCGGAAFIIHNYPRQYFDGPAVAEYISDPQLALLVAHHQGSLSVDWLSGDAPEMQQWITLAICSLSCPPSDVLRFWFQPRKRLCLFAPTLSDSFVARTFWSDLDFPNNLVQAQVIKPAGPGLWPS